VLSITPLPKSPNRSSIPAAAPAGLGEMITAGDAAAKFPNPNGSAAAAAPDDGAGVGALMAANRSIVGAAGAAGAAAAQGLTPIHFQANLKYPRGVKWDRIIQGVIGRNGSKCQLKKADGGNKQGGGGSGVLVH